LLENAFKNGFLARKFERKSSDFGKEIICEKGKFTARTRIFHRALVEALLL
jgi:hypothetical protein